MKIISIFLAFYMSVGACLPQGDFSQLMKMKNLMEHYELHKQTSEESGETMTFFEFVIDHFVDSDNHHHGDEDHHDDLPFQTIHSSITFFQPTQIIHSGEINLPSIELTVRFYTTDLSNNFAQGIFRPPCFA